MPKPLLELSTLERPVITIDGQEFELWLPADFGLTELVHIHRLQRAVEAVNRHGEAELTDEDIAQVHTALDELVHLVLPGLPAAVFGRLRDSHKLAVAQCFAQQAATRGKALPATTPAPSTSAS